MHDYYLTKSDFKVAQTCPTKLYYRKCGYPTLADADEQLSLLADQGYLVEALARTFYPDGRWVGYHKDVESAAWETMEALTDNCTLFEATFISGNKMARVDILVRRGDIFELIEVKAASFNRQENDERIQQGKPNLFRTSRPPDGIISKWQPYLEDVTYQTSILQDVFPRATIVPYLLMPDTSRPCRIDGLHRRFAMRSHHHRPEETLIPASEYVEDPREIRRNPLLVRVNVAAEVEDLLPEVRRQSEVYVNSLIPALKRVKTPLSTACRNCEYRVTDGELRGFHECWGELADVKPHILDLNYVSEAGGRKERLADNLIAQGKAGLLDLPEKELARKDGTTGERARRQRTQIQYTRSNREWASDELGTVLDSFTYPLHFVDFETCTPAIPHYRGMRPYDTLAFQWSCHTVSHPGAPARGSAWLQSGDDYPHAHFVGALRRQVGDTGSILVWATHEASVLRQIQAQLSEREGEGSELAVWVGRLLDSGRIIDLNQITLKHYFHPHMSGRTSLKVVADAIWQTNPGIRARFPQYLREDEEALVSPYRALHPVTIGGRDISVIEGLGAIAAYYQMMERTAANATLEAERWRALLLQYCELDTLAMVMVWLHWQELTRQMK